MGDALRDIAYGIGLVLKVEATTAASKTELFLALRNKLADDLVELHPDPVLRSDLLAVRRRVGQNGVTIDLPRTADGRHCDYAPALALVLGQVVDAPASETP